MTASELRKSGSERRCIRLVYCTANNWIGKNKVNVRRQHTCSAEALLPSLAMVQRNDACQQHLSVRCFGPMACKYAFWCLDSSSQGRLSRALACSCCLSDDLSCEFCYRVRGFENILPDVESRCAFATRVSHSGADSCVAVWRRLSLKIPSNCVDTQDRHPPYILTAEEEGSRDIGERRATSMRRTYFCYAIISRD